jgi:predicted RNase H-related nuclease YkuK (DUF458 family)
METMLGRAWKTVEGKRVVAPMEEIPAAVAGLKTIYVGTDSQQDRNKTQFVSVVVVLDPGHGGRAFWTKESVPRIKSLRERLLREAWMSVQLALEITPFVDELSQLEVHVDANTDTKFKSSQYVKELTSLVVSQGFSCKLKPEAWAAMHVADKVVKDKVIGR